MGARGLMTSEVVIDAEKLAKHYRIDHQSQVGRYKTLRESIGLGATTLGQSLVNSLRGQTRRSRSSAEEFWALKDVSFQVKRGEVVGVIGRNGAGKSTLLKILSRITEPTTGRVTIRGRIACLLEVGTGFHPELTGRENIYLNGAILGMSHAEIRRKFDEIVAFADVERFLDTPVKRYSSGMYVRLAFAVAAHLQPEILIVDEVLSVGDAEFQKKCLGKIQDVASRGRTVLFVSHNMAAVQNICTSGILLSDGKVASLGAIDELVRRYLSSSLELSQLSLLERRDRDGTGKVRFASLTFKDPAGQPLATMMSGMPLQIEIGLARSDKATLNSVRVALEIDDEAGRRVLLLSTRLAGSDFPTLESDVDAVSVHIPRLTLAPGKYGITLFCSVGGEIADWVKNAGSFDVEGGDFYGSGQMPSQGQGCMLIDHSFEFGRAAKPYIPVAREPKRLIA
jgi:lipopolysaccharide transport system ATP-binding protein